MKEKFKPVIVWEYFSNLFSRQLSLTWSPSHQESLSLCALLGGSLIVLITVRSGYSKKETEPENRQSWLYFKKPKRTAGSFHEGTSQKDYPMFRAVI
jgi:hypothetical protein